MIIKPKQWEECPTCRRRYLARDEVYGCDACGKEIDLNENTAYLRATNFHHGDGEAADFVFCSWSCFFAKLPMIEIDYFLDFPHLNAESIGEGLTIRNFWQAVKSCQMP